MSHVNPATGLYHYRDLDAKNEGAEAALRMQARADEPASLEMFRTLVSPLLGPQVRRVLEVGCGSGALSRRIAGEGDAAVYATDKSAAMVAFARSKEDGSKVTFEAWDVTSPSAFPFGDEPFDLIISSVMVPYLSAAECAALVTSLSARLRPGGTLAFLEQDLMTDALYFPNYALFAKVLSRDTRNVLPSFTLGLRPLLRNAGLSLAAPQSFLWTDRSYGAYLRNLLGKNADDAVKDARISPEERAEWNDTLEALVRSGDFYYGLVYHLVAGKKA